MRNKANQVTHFVWEHWRWVRFSPLLVLVFGVTVSFLEPGTDDVAAVSIMWMTVAGISAIVADLMRRRTKRLMRIAREDLVKEDPLRVLTETNHFTVVKTEMVHLLFFGLGISLFVFPLEVRQIIARTDILLGQYLLFLISSRCI